MATMNGKTLEELQSEVALLEAKLELARAAKAKSKKGISFQLERKSNQLAATAPEFVPSGGTPRYVVPKPTEADRKSVERYHHHDEYVSPTPSRTPSPQPTRTKETPTAPTDAASPNSEWFKFMREEREASDRRLETMFERMNVRDRPRDRPRDDINKAIPQVQPMKDGADLREYFQLFELTQLDRRTPTEAYAGTLRPLLNSACFRIISRQPAEIQTSYTKIKAILLEQADARHDATIQQFWEHRKPKSDTWQEELAELRKLAHRCAPSDDGESVREIFVVEQLIQQLPKTIQQFVRERNPETPEKTLQDTRPG